MYICREKKGRMVMVITWFTEGLTSFEEGESVRESLGNAYVPSQYKRYKRFSSVKFFDV